MPVSSKRPDMSAFAFQYVEVDRLDGRVEARDSSSDRWD